MAQSTGNSSLDLVAMAMARGARYSAGAARLQTDRRAPTPSASSSSHGRADDVTFSQALVLALLQGVSELFPISSLGHTISFRRCCRWHNIDRSSTVVSRVRRRAPSRNRARADRLLSRAVVRDRARALAQPRARPLEQRSRRANRLAARRRQRSRSAFSASSSRCRSRHLSARRRRPRSSCSSTVCVMFAGEALRRRQRRAVGATNRSSG